jgi:hypothetical protein
VRDNFLSPGGLLKKLLVSVAVLRLYLFAVRVLSQSGASEHKNYTGKVAMFGTLATSAARSNPSLEKAQFISFRRLKFMRLVV